MKKLKRSLCALLAAIIVPSALSACLSETADTPESELPKEMETAAVTTEKTYIPDLPDEDFDGRELKILAWFRDATPITDICAYETTGEPLNDAIFKRNSTIEERYNVSLAIEEEERLQLGNLVKNAVLAQEERWGFVDISLMHCVQLSSYGYLMNLMSLNYIDPEAEWWDQRCREELSILHKLFFDMGDINIYDNSETYGLIFNKKLAESFNLENMYTLVDEGKWTIDKVYGMICAVSSDIDGNGVMDELDRWGMYSQGETEQYFLGAGERIARKDENDIPYLTANTERGIAVLEKAYKISTDSENVFLTGKWGKTLEGHIFLDHVIPAFKNDLGLFYSTAIGNTYKNLRDMESEYGIVPVPKYEESQDGYQCGMLPGWASAVAIPINVENPDFPAFLLEALAAESVLTLTKTYTEQCFNTKGARDADSIRMAELIARSHCFDIGSYFGWGGISSMITGLVNETEMNFSSKYASLESAALQAMEKTIAQYREID